MYIYPIKPDEIFHYGMPRRSGRYPWGSGERPFQGEISKKDIKDAEKGKRRSEAFDKDHTLRRGTIVYRSTLNKDEENTNNPMYVSYLSPERNLYRSGTAKTVDKEIGNVYERTMVLKEDLNIASSDKLKEVAKKISKDKQILKEAVEWYYDMAYPEDGWFRTEHFWDWEKDTVDKKLWDKYVNDAYEKVKDEPFDEGFSIMMASLGKNNILKERMISELKKEGYSAMQDLAGTVGGKENIEGIDPLIVFNPKDAIENVSIKETVGNESNKYRKSFNKWQRKAARNF